MNWTTPQDIADRLHRKWKNGELLRAHAAGDAFPVLEVPLRGPSAHDLGDHLEAIRKWATALRTGSRDGRRYRLVNKTIGGRNIGRSEIPGRAVIESYAQAWHILGVAGPGSDVEVFDELLRTSAQEPSVHSWILRYPLRAIELAPSWPKLLAARDWLEFHRDTGLYLRQIDAPGVDTKFMESHRGVLADFFGVSAAKAAFATSLGFIEKPTYLRLRFSPGVVDFPAGLTEATLRLDELKRLAPDISTAIIIENEITYLSVPIPKHGVVIFGKGFDVTNAESISWLGPIAAQSRVYYWGDIDAQGFEILHGARTTLPQLNSLLMDRDTLLQHRQQWVTGTKASRRALDQLSADERALYDDLVTNHFGDTIRLEQERINWAWVLKRLERLDSAV